MQEKTVQLIGWLASGTAVMMYLSYIDQIRLNLDGGKGSIVQPAATLVNCILWTTYGVARERKDWPMIIANLPGIVLGAVALVTAL